MLKKEQKYTQELIINITNKNLDNLIQDSSIDPNADADFLSVIKDIYNQTVNSKNTLGLMDNEHHFMKELQSEIERVMNAPPASLQDTSERLQEALHAKIDTLLTDKPKKNNLVSSGFKTFINHVCKAINITSPFSQTAKSKQDIIQKFDELKQMNEENRPPSPDIETPDNSGDNTPQSPAA